MKLKLLIFISFFFCSISQSQVVTDFPLQENFERPFIIKEEKGYTITALAKFELTARVLGIESYSMDTVADIAPYDFALGWRDMSSEQFISNIKIRQSNRFYYWYTSDADTYAQKNKIITQSANMHLIPSSKQIKRALDRASKGKNFYIKGYLVKVTKENLTWISSMVRTDTGAGACEIIWVTEAIPL